MKKNCKTLLALLLVLSLTLGLLPGAALAASGKTGFARVTLEDGTALSWAETGSISFWGMYDFPVYTVTVPEGTETILLYDDQPIAIGTGYVTGYVSEDDPTAMPVNWSADTEGSSSPYHVQTRFGEEQNISFVKRSSSLESDADAYFLAFTVGETQEPSADPAISADLNAAQVTYLLNDTAVALAVDALGANLSYQWYLSTVSDSDGFTAIEGETNASYTPPTGAAGDFWYQVQITNAEDGMLPTTVKSTAAHITVTAPVGTAEVILSFGPADAVFYLTDGEGNPVDLPEPGTDADGYACYTAWLAPGAYLFEAVAEAGTDSERSLGGGTLTVTGAAKQAFSYTLLWVYPAMYGWTAADFTTALYDGGNNLMTAGDAYKFASYVGTPYMLPSDITYRYEILPSAERQTEGYPASVSGQANNNKSNYHNTASQSLIRTTAVPFTVPADAVITLSPWVAYALPVPMTPAAPASDNGDGTQSVSYTMTEKQSYLLRVSMPGGVTYARNLTASGSILEGGLVVTEAMLIPDGMTPDTTVRDLSANGGYNVADLYLNATPSGVLRLNEGGVYQLQPMRSWQAASSTTITGNTVFAEPDFHYTVLDEYGGDSAVVEVNADGLITAKQTGTALVLVTYDAMTAPASLSSDHFFGAIWPENTGVLVVTVGAGAGPDTGMKLHPGNTNNALHKLAGDAPDAELDPFYYCGDDGYPYTFTPAEGSAVTLLRPDVADEMSYSGGFAADGITENDDGSVTVLLTEGRNIVRVTKDGQSSYQVLTAKHQEDPAITNLTNPGLPVQPGDKVQVVLDTVYLPVSRMTGLYNFSARVSYTGADAATYTGASATVASSYKFATATSARTLTVTIPANWDVNQPFTLTDGGIEITGGSAQAFGSHRLMTAGGLTASSTATRTGLLGALPDLSIPVQEKKLFTVALEAKDSLNAALEGCTIVFYRDGTEAARSSSGTVQLPYGVYTYSVHKAGYTGVYGALTINDTSPAEQTVAAAMGDTALENAWDGLTSTAPTQEDNIYRIGTGAELKWFADQVNTGTNTISATLTADIDLAGYRWTPIGYNGKLFKGSFDGAGHRIHNLNITESGVSNVGFFGNTSGYNISGGVSIRDLTIASGSVNVASGSSTRYIGALVGKAETDTAITNCTNRADVIVTGPSASSVGGMVGYLYGATLTNCFNYGAVENRTGGTMTAGLAGESAMAKSGIYQSANHGAVTSTGSYTGGIISYTSGANATLRGCYNTGAITGAGSTGGIAGQTGSPLSQCYNTGVVTGTSGVGGIVGKLVSSESTAIDLYNTGVVTGEGFVGGLVGQTVAGSRLSNGYNTGTAIATAEGGLAGAIAGQASGNLEKLYYFPGLTNSIPGVASGTPQSGSATAKTMAELKALTVQELSDNFLSDAAGVNNGFPILLWQAEIAAIHITKQPTKLTYTAGDSLKLDGMVVKATVNGSAVTLDNTLLSVSPTSFPTAGTVTVTVRYLDKSDSFTVQVSPYVPPDPAAIYIETTLTDGMVQKGSRRTFDVTALDPSGEKIPVKDLTVQLNGVNVRHNWDDSVKTSYTLVFTQAGENIVTIQALTKTVSYTIQYTPAKPGETIGQAVFALEAFTLGGGYILAPQYVDIVEGQNSAQLLTSLLKENGMGYRSTGSVTSGFYLSSVTGSALESIDVTGASIPQVLRKVLPYAVSARSSGSSLGEFDYTQGSGWMYCANNVFPNVGFADNYLGDGDVVRVQFTLAYGADIGGGYSTGGAGGGLYTVSDKDALTAAIAEVGLDEVPKSVLKTVMKLDASQSEVDAAVKALSNGQVTPPTTGGGKEEVTTTLNPEVTVGADGSAKVEMSAEDISSALLDAQDQGATRLVIAPVIQGQATKVSVTLPQEAMAELAGEKDLRLTVQTGIADITLPSGVLSGLSKGGGVALSAETLKDKDGKPTGQIRVEVNQGGKALAEVPGGMTVSLPVQKAGPGTVLALVAKDGKTQIISKSALQGDAIAALLGGSATVVVIDNGKTFSDVGTSYWGSDAVAFVTARDLFQGTSAADFSPNGDMTRAMLVTVLSRLEDTPAPSTSASTFGDVQAGAWYTDAVAWAAEQNLISGTGAGFQPDGSITRESLCTILYRYAASVGMDTGTTGRAAAGFQDTATVSPWATDAVSWCVETGLLTGKSSGALDPAGNASRAEVAVILQRLVGQMVQ